MLDLFFIKTNKNVDTWISNSSVDRLIGTAKAGQEAQADKGGKL